MNAWETHLPFLRTQLADADGPVLELGAGLASTPLFEAYARRTGCFTLTMETNERWMRAAIDACRDGGEFSPAHSWRTVHSWRAAVGNIVTRRWYLAFVDCAPGRDRPMLIELLRNRAEVVVVHDTEAASADHYQWGSSLDGWASRVDMTPPGFTQQTTILSSI